MAAGFLGLVALHAVGSKGSKGRVASAMTDVANIVERVLSPNVAAIPDRRPGGDTAAERAAAGTGSKAKTSDRFTGRLPIPDPPK
jgi:hypothetical protein